jgi:hypothetical protein
MEEIPFPVMCLCRSVLKKTKTTRKVIENFNNLSQVHGSTEEPQRAEGLLRASRRGQARRSCNK